MKCGGHHTEEARTKMSAAHMGCKLSFETRAKLSAIMKVRKDSPEAIAHKSAANKKRMLELSIEDRAKMCAAMSAADKLRRLSPEHRAKISASLWKGGRKVTASKAHCKRRSLGFIPLNQPFSGSEAHHVDPEQVIFLPKVLHRSIRHNVFTGRNMAKINAEAYNFLFRQEVVVAIQERYLEV